MAVPPHPGLVGRVAVVDVGAGWSELEPDSSTLSPSALSVLDQFVTDARSFHIAVRFQLTEFPEWARDRGDPSEHFAPWYAPTNQDELERWGAWVRAVIGHFGTRVSFYEIWNEENADQFWAQGPDPTQYAALLACSYVAAKDTNTRVTVMSGGLSTNDVGYLQRLYKSLARYPYASSMHNFFDVLGSHPYSDGRSPAVNSRRWVTKDQWGLDDVNFLGFTRIHQVMLQHGDGSKQIYIGEYGIPVDSSSPAAVSGFSTVSAETLAKWLPLAYSLAARYPYVAALSWYAFYPDAYDAPAWAIVRNGSSSSTVTEPTTVWTETPSFRALVKVPTARLVDR